MPEPQIPGKWREFLVACGSSGEEMRQERALWDAWDKVAPFLRGETYTSGDEIRFRDAINRFTELFIKCWGEGHVTHYIHILYAHGPWLIKQHGSLGVWQCQGMEKSHWRARGIYQKHTNHDGGRQSLGELSKSSLYQLVRFEYRLLQHRRRELLAKAARAEIEQANHRRKVNAQQVYARWYRAASEEKKTALATNASKARAQQVRIRQLRSRELEKIRQDIKKCHGIVSSFEGQSPCTPC